MAVDRGAAVELRLSWPAEREVTGADWCGPASRRRRTCSRRRRLTHALARSIIMRVVFG